MKVNQSLRMCTLLHLRTTVPGTHYPFAELQRIRQLCEGLLSAFDPELSSTHSAHCGAAIYRHIT